MFRGMIDRKTDIHLVRTASDLTAAMPRFVTAFLEQQFSASS